MQFRLEDEKLLLKSIDATEIIYAEQLWVYNTKTRKLGHYKAKVLDPRGLSRPGTGLTVKGTSIKGFDEEMVTDAKETFQSLMKIKNKDLDLTPYDVNEKFSEPLFEPGLTKEIKSHERKDYEGEYNKQYLEDHYETYLKEINGYWRRDKKRCWSIRWLY